MGFVVVNILFGDRKLRLPEEHARAPSGSRSMFPVMVKQDLSPMDAAAALTLLVPAQLDMSTDGPSLVVLLCLGYITPIFLRFFLSASMILTEANIIRDNGRKYEVRTV
jgi:hypothetical protein